MFRVPLSADQRTLEPYETISFWRWLTSSKAQRADWAHRKSTVFGTRGQERIDNWGERHGVKRDRDDQKPEGGNDAEPR